MSDLTSLDALLDHLPSDWFSPPIRNVAQLINGRGFKPYEWDTDGLPIIRIQNLNGSPVFNYYSGSYNPKIEVEKGDLLFAWSGSRGTSFGPHFWNGPRGVLNYHTWKVKVDDRAISPDFFFHALRFLTRIIEDRAHGASALVHVQKWEMEKFGFPCPEDRTEQKAIAAALSDADGVVAGLERVIAKKRLIKQGAMQDLLTARRRLPGFSGEWEVKRLGENCRITTGKKDVNAGNPSGQFPFFTCAREHTYSDVFSFDCEAILIAGNGEVGNLNRYKGKFEAYQRTYVLHSFDIDLDYLWQVLKLRLSDALGLGKIGSSIPYIKKGDLIDFEFDLPASIPEQQAIAAVLSDMDAEIQTLESRLTKARAVKEGMMQNLLTGRVRLV